MKKKTACYLTQAPLQHICPHVEYNVCLTVEERKQLHRPELIKHPGGKQTCAVFLLMMTVIDTLTSTEEKPSPSFKNDAC